MTMQWTAIPDSDGEGDWYVVGAQEEVVAIGLTEPASRLIAAAPTMLTALKAIRAYHNGGREYSMDMVDAAIARAEGTS